MTSAPRALRWLALVWLAWALLCVGHNAWLWTRSGTLLDTDVLAMLPQDERDPLAASATRLMASAAERRVIVLVGGADWPAAQHAGDAFAASLADQTVATLRYRVDDQAQQTWLDFYAPHRAALLSAATREQLTRQTTPQLADQALAWLYQPVAGPRVGRWADDPLNLLGQWLAERSQLSRVRVLDGRLALQDGAQAYAILMLELQASAFDIAGPQALQPLLAQGRAAALQASPKVQVIQGGVPLFAAAAAAQAQHEVHTIGIGSLVGIVLLTLLVFRSLRPRLLVTLSMAVGLLTAITVSALVFQRLHLITLVFGASLLGVAENYGSNYFSARLGLAPEQRWQMLREQAPVMGLAMLTTVIGYALLALTPFPGLQQIAVFSAVGLLAAFVTVLLWFPLLDGGQMQPTRFAQWLGGWRASWPQWGQQPVTAIGVALALAVLAAGAWRFQANDDIRQLQNAPPQLVQDQRELGRLMDLPGVAQFFIVQGADEQQLLAREEALTTRLRALQASGQLRGWQAVSDWVPSAARQAQDLALLHQRFDGEAGLTALLAQRLEQPVDSPLLAQAPPALTLQAWLASPVSEPLRHQFLGQLGGGPACAVLLRGAESTDARTRLAALAAELPGVRWVDKVADVSSLLGRYRVRMSGVILLAYGLVWAALAWRFGRAAWRALLPTALASVLTVALLALAGQPLQLFHVLPLLILLGLGVDYGIFLLERPAPEATRPFLSVTLAAACTLLSFGLLALSGTPALRAFGLTLLIGVTLAWALTPVFLPRSPSSPN